jgi:UDP-N-acetyl-2-amino-2-deoxyglucuronate dehydrogenase
VSHQLINFGLVGCGKIGTKHAALMNEFGTLKAVCDIDETKSHQLSSQYSVNQYNSIEALLNSEIEIDVVAICTPNGLHAKHSIQSLQAGKHVLCEKPMALSVTDCEAMMEASEKAKKKLFIVKQNRYNPPVVAVKKMINEGKLGKIFNVQLNCFWNRNDDYYKDDWRGTKALDGGILFTQFSHFIDILYWMMGDFKTVHSIKKNFLHQQSIELEDTGVAVVEFNNGAIGTINYTVNSHHKNMEGSLTIFGEKGTVKIGGEYLNTIEYQDIENVVIEHLPQGNQANDYGTYQGSMSNHNKVYEHIINVLKNHINTPTNTFESMKTVEMINKINSSNT